jgi:hypothetical protein
MKDTVARLGQKSPAMTADSLTVDLIPFRDEVQKVIRRGKMVITLLQQEGADPSRIQREGDAITKELLDVRLRVTYAFQETLTLIIKQNGL